MCGNGAATGMALIAAVRKLTLRELFPVLTVFCGVVVGTAVRGAAECRIGTASIPTAGTTAAVCVLFFSLCFT